MSSIQRMLDGIFGTSLFFFFQAEDGIRDRNVTGVQTCALPIFGPVDGDPERLQQVVWNLLSNALKFTPRGGCVEIALERQDGLARIAVSDTGEGKIGRASCRERGEIADGGVSLNRKNIEYEHRR